MAALRLRKVRVITPEDARKYDRWIQKGLKRGRPPKFAGKLPGKQVYLWEIVATTAPEAASGLFQPIGDLMVFIPEQVEDHLWQRLRTMDQPQHRELWDSKYWGIKKALRKLGIMIRQEVPNFPAGLLDWQTHEDVPAVLDPITKKEVTPRMSAGTKFYEAFVRDHWLPHWLYSSRLARKGKFKNTRRAQAVASAFGIDVDTAAKSPQWFRTSTPEVLAEAEQNIIVPEDTFQDIKQSWISMMERRLAQGQVIDFDWDVAVEQYRGYYGIKAKQIIDRLKRELEPIIAQMKAGTYRFEHNKHRAYPLASSTRR